MLRHELLEKFYNEFGYLPDGDELKDFENDLKLHDYPDKTIYRDQDITRTHSTQYEPQDELLQELGLLFHDVSKSAKKSLRGAQERIITDDRVEEFNSMLITFLLKSSLYFVLKKSYEKGYNFNDL